MLYSPASRYRIYAYPQAALLKFQPIPLKSQIFLCSIVCSIVQLTKDPRNGKGDEYWSPSKAKADLLKPFY